MYKIIRLKRNLTHLYDLFPSALNIKEEDLVKDVEYPLKILSLDVIGNFDRFSRDSTMEGSLYWSALCEFGNRTVIPLEIGNDIDIIDRG